MNALAGECEDCGDSDLITICAGIFRKPGDFRLVLLNKNAGVRAFFTKKF